MSDNSDDELSEVSDDAEQNPYQLPTTNPTIFDYRQALDYSHEQQRKLLNHNVKLRQQVLEIRSRLKAVKQSSALNGRRTKKMDPLLNRGKILLWGKKYAIAVAPWASPEYFIGYPADSSPSPDSKARFASFEAFKAGGCSELHQYLAKEPEMCNQAAEYLGFRDAFMLEINASRSTSIHKVCESASTIFGSLNLPDFWPRAMASQRRDSPAFKNLLYFPGEDKPKTLIPLFYPNLKKQPELLFMNECLPKILRHMLFGKLSLTAKTFKFEARLLGSKWGVERVNDSMIAFSAITAKYLVSNDEAFHEEGSASNIPYFKEFWKIRFLLKSIEGTHNYQRLYAFWNKNVFQGKVSSAGDTSDADESDMNDVTDALKALTVSNEPGPSQSNTATLSQSVPSEGTHAVLNPDLSDLSDIGEEIGELEHNRSVAPQPAVLVEQSNFGQVRDPAVGVDEQAVSATEIGIDEQEVPATDDPNPPAGRLNRRNASRKQSQGDEMAKAGLASKVGKKAKGGGNKAKGTRSSGQKKP